MESDDRKATLINCIVRSLMFDTVARLDGLDSGYLFLMGIAASQVIVLAVSLVISLASGSKGFSILEVFFSVMVGIIVELIISIPGTFLVAFIFNLFLADDIVKIANIITFSRVYLWLFEPIIAKFPQAKYTWIVSTIAFVVFIALLVMNIRALRRK